LIIETALSKGRIQIKLNMLKIDKGQHLKTGIMLI